MSNNVLYISTTCILSLLTSLQRFGAYLNCFSHLSTWFKGLPIHMVLGSLSSVMSTCLSPEPINISMALFWAMEMSFCFVFEWHDSYDKPNACSLGIVHTLSQRAAASLDASHASTPHDGRDRRPLIVRRCRSNPQADACSYPQLCHPIDLD